MGVYATRKCPKCKYPLETLQRDYIAIGPPFTYCPRCGIPILLDHITEWDLMNLDGKLYHIIVHCWTCFFYGIGGAAIVLTFCFLGLAKLGMNPSTRNVLLLAIPCLLGGVVFVVYRFRLFIREIGTSRQRMLDPEYSEELNRLLCNLLKEPPGKKGENK